MKIHEFQAKQLLRQYQLPVPEGEVAESAEQVRSVAERLPGPGYAVKAQIHAGGRGKAGGVKVVEGVDAAAEAAERMLGSRLVTHQTGPEGSLVRRVLVEQVHGLAQEFYLGFVVDRASERVTLMASREGGVEIETVAAERPEAIVKEAIDPALGLRPYQARRVALALGLKSQLRQASQLMAGLYKAFVAYDASLLEINPLVLTDQGQLLLLDAKLNLEDSALGRHPELAELRDVHEEAPLEVEASRYDLNYIKLDGRVGCMVNGAGLAMATMDLIKLHGSSPANFLDVGGGADVERISNAFRILSSDPDVEAILINIFGGIVRCDRVADGVIQALEQLDVEAPIVIRLEGTNAAEAAATLEASDLSFTVANSLADAAAKVVAALPQQ